MSRTLEETQTPINAPVVQQSGLDPVSSTLANVADGQQTLRIAGINNERMLEPTPKYIRAGGEKVLQHGNMSIVFGRDRPGGRDSGYGGRGHTGTSTMDMVAGRQCSPVDSTLNYDPNITQDAARLYISQKTDIDRNFNTPGDSRGRSGVGLKADAIRLIGRESIMLVTRTEDTNSRGGSAGYGGISLVANNEASELQPMVKGYNLINALQEIDNRIKEVHTTLHNHIKDQKAFNEKVQKHTHEGTCPVGPVSTLVSTTLVPGGFQAVMAAMERMVDIFKQRMNVEIQEVDCYAGLTFNSINSKYNKVS